MQTLVGWKTRLQSWGYEPVFCSVDSKSGLDALAFILKDQTTVIVGPSGVGKSSLINTLRSSHHASDAEEGDNWFDPVGLISFCFISSFSYYLFFVLACDLGIFSTFVNVLLSDSGRQVV